MTRSHEIIDWKSGDPEASNDPKQLRILAPINFDDDSRRSRLTAIELAAQWGANVTFLHVSPLERVLPERTGLDAIGLLHSVLRAPAGPAMSHGDQELQLHRLEGAAIRRMKRMIPAAWSDKIRATFAWRSGEVHVEIVAHAMEHEIDVIVLGTRDQPRPWRLSRGVARRVIQTAPCQVLVAYPSGQASVDCLPVDAAAS
ncbi:universal stress protein [Lacipirellula sp.]|uniref:universal stress protein n=1 Tax=Lacipirellula sp. TaxID=2691419 RepID=UPI003D11D53A